MSVAPYPEYKDSGVEWIGEMPSHWDQRRLGTYLTERREKVSDKEFPPLSVTKNGIVPQLDNAAKTDDGDNRKKVCAGDFVINGRSDRKGSSGLSSLEGSVSLINIVLRPHAVVEMRFIGWLLKSAPFQEEFYRYGKGIVADLWSTNFSEMRNIVLAMPPVLEQSAIAAFLDQETGKIDALVAEQERLIALLKEKRQAVISQAVTKGLNPNAPMKDSGIEWLGQVPAHWKLGRLKQFGTLQGGTGFPPDLQGIEGEELPFYKVSDLGASEDGIRMGSGSHSISQTTADGLRAKIIPAGSIVYAKIGAALLLNRRRITTIECCIDNNLSAYTPLRDWLCSAWAYYWLSIIDFGKAVNPGAVPSFSEGDQSILPILIPPMPEQDRLIEHIGMQTSKINSLITEATQAITLLRERRAALISAAVTGKIDVRALAPSQPEAA